MTRSQLEVTQLEIQLLGPPRITRAGPDPPAPRGQKAWGLLAYLVLSEIRNPTREHLAGLLFSEAADPLRSLRWNLSELRRALGHEVLERGQETLDLPADARVDVAVLTRGTPQEALSLPGLGLELLAGMDFSAAPAFDGWLLHERHRLIGSACAALHEAALDRLAAGRPKDAVPLARRLVELEPHDENFEESLLRAYAQSGDRRQAQQQLESFRASFRREFDREPAESLGRAVEEPVAEAGPPPSFRLSMERAATALLEAGEAAAAAGAIDAALESLRRAAAAARDTSAGELEARSLFALGSTLVHGVRGRDEEGASILKRAASLAEEFGLADLQAGAVRELSYIDALAGRYSRCESRLAEAASIAESEQELAAVESIWAMSAGDRGAHETAGRHIERAVELAEGSGDQQRAAFSLSFAGRSQLLTGDLEGARSSFESARAIVKDCDWLAFASWPEAWLAELELTEGRVEEARERMEYAFSLAREFRDPCWEGLAGRGLGLIEERDGNPAVALRRLESARQTAASTTDCYVWVEAYALEAMAGVAVRADSSRASPLVADLLSLAARTGMREMAVKAFLYQSELGERGARDAAQVMAAEIENPALAAKVKATGANL